MKIAHVSDLHFSTFFKINNLQNIRYLFKYVLDQNPDHIILTGDLTDNAEPGDFLILRNLFKKLDILKSDRLSVVIGNHDIFGGVQKADDIFSFHEKCSQLDFQAKVNRFYDFFFETFENTHRISSDHCFPFVKNLGNVQLTGINSIAHYSKVKNPFASNGEISLPNLNDLSDLMGKNNSNNTIKIVLIHHHFNKIKIDKEKKYSTTWQKIEKQTMKLRKKKRIINLLNGKNVDLVLHGHYHENHEYSKKGIKFLNAGASIINHKPGIMHGNFIEVGGKEITTEIHKIESNSSIVKNRQSLIKNTERNENRLVGDLVLN